MSLSEKAPYHLKQISNVGIFNFELFVKVYNQTHSGVCKAWSRIRVSKPTVNLQNLSLIVQKYSCHRLFIRPITYWGENV